MWDVLVLVEGEETESVYASFDTKKEAEDQVKELENLGVEACVASPPGVRDVRLAE